MDIEKLKAFLESPEGKESMVRFAEKMRVEQENEDKWKNHVLNHLNKFTDEDLAWELDLFFIWEEALEERYYKQYIQTSSCIMNILYKVWVENGVDLELEEDFLSSAHEYRGHIFKLYCGQGCFYRVLRNGETIHQST
jgi:hypothetical protein